MEPGAHQALCRAAVEIIEAIPKYKATHHRRLQNGLNSDKGRQLPTAPRRRQTLHEAAGFWASSELPVVVWADYAS